MINKFFIRRTGHQGTVRLGVVYGRMGNCNGAIEKSGRGRGE